MRSPIRFCDLVCHFCSVLGFSLFQAFSMANFIHFHSQCATAAEARTLDLLLRLCIGHILASETQQPQHQSQRTSALPSTAALASHALPIMTATDVFDALPALASTLVGWLLEYPIIYCLLSPHEVAEWGTLLFENETPAAASVSAQTCAAKSVGDFHGIDFADCSQWWSRRGDPRVAALVAQTLARGGDRRHALSGSTAWLFEVYAQASGGMEGGYKGGISIAMSANQKDEDSDVRGDDDDDDDAFASSMLRSRKPTKAATKTHKSSKAGQSLPSSLHAKRETDSEFCYSFSLPSAQCAAAYRRIAGSDIKDGNYDDKPNAVSEDEALARLLARYRASLAASASAHATALCINVRATRTLLEHVAL